MIMFQNIFKLQTDTYYNRKWIGNYEKTCFIDCEFCINDRPF